MAQYRPIWTDEALGIVRDKFNSLGPNDTRELVIRYCKQRAESEGGRRYVIPSLRGVIWQAHSMGLITDSFKTLLDETTYRKPIPPKQRNRILKRDGMSCLNCGNASNLEVDHIVPVFDGGKNDDYNLQTLCRICHKIKGISDISVKQMKSVINACGGIRFFLCSSTDGATHIKFLWPDWINRVVAELVLENFYQEYGKKMHAKRIEYIPFYGDPDECTRLATKSYESVASYTVLY